MDNCSKCVFFGLVENSKECAIWGCTRINCISIDNNSYHGSDFDDLANSYGYDNYQDFCEIVYFKFLYMINRLLYNYKFKKTLPFTQKQYDLTHKYLVNKNRIKKLEGFFTR